MYRLVQQTIQLEVGSQNQKPQATLLLSAGGHSQSIEPEAEQIAQQLQALHVDASNLQPHLQPYASFERASLTSSLHALIEQLQRRLDLIRWCPSISSVPSSSSTANQSKPFLRILICMCCGDLLPLEQLLNSLAPNSKWTRKSNRSVIVSISLPEKISSRKNSAQLRLQPVELLLSSFHGAQAYQDELLHGFLLLAAADRPSSYSAVQEFTQQIPNTPTQLIVHRIQMDYDRNDSLATALAAAEKQQYDQIATFAKSIGAHCTDFSLDRLPLSLNDFFAELIERKPHIERAFHSESDEDEFRLEQANQADLALRADGCVPPPLPVRSTLQTLQVEPTRSAPIKPARNVYRLRNRTESDKIPDFRCFSASPADHHRTSSSDQADTPSPLPVADRNLPVAVSDDSDIYASVFNQKSDEHLLKPSQIRQRRAIQTGSYDAHHSKSIEIHKVY